MLSYIASCVLLRLVLIHDVSWLSCVCRICAYLCERDEEGCLQAMRLKSNLCLKTSDVLVIGGEDIGGDGVLSLLIVSISCLQSFPTQGEHVQVGSYLAAQHPS